LQSSQRLINCFLLDKNKLQLKASLDNNKQFSCKQLTPECKNFLAPMYTHAQEKQPQPPEKNPHKSEKNNLTSFVEPT
jgi:hypothetical protein